MFLCLFLGDLCGLLPSCEPSSQQLHFVVELSSGIRDSSIEVQGKATPINPVDRLKEALSSKVAFQKYYLVRAAYILSVEEILKTFMLWASFFSGAFRVGYKHV